MCEKVKSRELGWVTEDELRRIYDDNSCIEEGIRDWIRDSDREFVWEQMDELKGVIRFETDAWDNVYAWPSCTTCYCGDFASAIRNSIFSYPSVIEGALSKLERYAEGVGRIGRWDVPEHFDRAISEQMDFVADTYAKCLKDDLQWWMDAPSEDIRENYFMDDFDDWLSRHPDVVLEYEELKEEEQKSSRRHKAAVAVSSGVFRKSFPKRAKTSM